MTARPKCSRDGCDAVVVGRRLCHRHYQQAWKAAEFVNAPLPPRARDQKVCPPEHKHDGSSTCYIQHQCRCDPCRAGHSKRELRRKKLKAYGRWDDGLVDAAPVREHLMMLAEYGMGYKRVAQLAGIGITPTRNLIWGRQDPGPRYGELQKRVKRETAEALLAVKPELANLAPAVSISSRGTRRRLQALIARGWSQSKLGARLGIDPGNFTQLMRRERVTVRVHRAVVELYDELWDQLPPRDEWRDKSAYNRTVRFAAQRRWLPPLAWDDIDLDDEPPVQDDEAHIDPVAVELAMHGEPVRLSSPERREAVRRLHAERWSDPRIAAALHCTDRTVFRIRQELGLEAYDYGDLRHAAGAGSIA